MLPRPFAKNHPPSAEGIFVLSAFFKLGLLCILGELIRHGLMKFGLSIGASILLSLLVILLTTYCIFAIRHGIVMDRPYVIRTAQGASMAVLGLSISVVFPYSAVSVVLGALCAAIGILMFLKNTSELHYPPSGTGE